MYFTKEEQQLMFDILDDLTYFATLHPETSTVNMNQINRLCDYIIKYKIREKFTIKKYFKTLVLNYKIKMYKAILDADKSISNFNFIMKD